MFTSEIKTAVLEASARAIATTGPHGVNVVPVSVVDIKDDCIVLYNFFMGKTVENLLAEPVVALTVWSGLQGVQIKARTVYETNGADYEAEVVIMKERFPDRTLAGIIKLTPVSIYDISAGSNAGMQLS